MRRMSLVATVLHVPLVTSSFQVRQDGRSRNGIARRSFSRYMHVERGVRLSPAHLCDTGREAPPQVWSELVRRGVRPETERDEGRLENLRRTTGLEYRTLKSLRPDIFEVHIGGKSTTIESAYAALLSSITPIQQIAALAGLIQLYLARGDRTAAGYLHALLSFTLRGAELQGSGNVIRTGWHVYEREGFRGLRDVALLSAKRRSRNLSNRVRRR